MIVTPDASVLLKWVLPGDDEQDGGAALSLRDEAVAGAVELVVPQLWLYEGGQHAGEAVSPIRLANCSRRWPTSA